MTSIDFQTAVIEKSFDKPVVVDFWAPWCGPCRMLSPIIEQMAAEQSDVWTLVKVNTEEAPDLAEQYQIMSIPNVKMFHNGKVVGEFMGAYPRPAIERWLKEYLPDERKASLDNILSTLDDHADAATLNKLEAFVQANPDVQEAKLAFAKQIVFGQPDWALELIEDFHLGDPLYDDAEDIRTLAEWMQMESDGSKVAQVMSKAREAARERNSENAIQQVIESTTLDKTFQNDLPRRVAIALFRRWGHQHPLTQNYRWRFDMALY